MATGSTGVYGGVDYNTADAATKKKLIQAQLKLNTDSSYKQSETSRALQAYKDRQDSGLDTSAQAKYLTNQLGYTGALPSATPAAASVGSTAAPVTASAAAKSNTSQSSELMDLMKAYATKQATPFSFNYSAEADPEYQNALKRAASNIDTGNAQVQAENNRRGILNSTITTDRGSEIAAKEMGNVETTVMPQLAQQAYSRAYQAYADQQAQEQAQFANLGNLSQMYTNEDQRGIDNTNTRAGLTGNLPGDDQAQQLYSQLLTLKQQAESSGVTAAERTKLSNQADGIRAMLSTMGVDTSKLGANTNYSTASQVTPTIRTLQGQSLDAQKLAQQQAQEQQQWENRFNYGQAIGQFSNGQKTLQAQQMDTANNQYTEQFAYQKARDAITDQRWKTEFDENVRQYGLGYGLQQLSQSSDDAYRQTQLALSQDDNSRAWAQLDYDQSQPAASKYSGMTASQVLDNMKALYSEPVLDKYGDATGKTQMSTDTTKRKEMFESVVDAGLSDTETKQILLSLGYTSKDIDTRIKQYSGN
ncbi:hypothetical protein BSK49_00945 [Paenibacillus odorifer]|uniref:hypothetical protein n=1 Tax=Paenibacillus odorifer TaxID=189426 RepID=UPI00096CE011|nr:hypothetical protein [Paenibacillus odorifer]OMD92982.1 hypothetical protein BSK49_00945 [Paenibacillus odorifer]